MRIQLIEYKNLNLVEFTRGDEMADCELCTVNSKFIHGSVFAVFQAAFLMSNKDFSYFEINSYEGARLVNLRNHLQDYKSRISNVRNAQNFEILILKQAEGIIFINELKTSNPDWRIRWERLREELKMLIGEIIEMVDDCIDEEKVFWVRGY